MKACKYERHKVIPVMIFNVISCFFCAGNKRRKVLTIPGGRGGGI